LSINWHGKTDPTIASIVCRIKLNYDDYSLFICSNLLGCVTEIAGHIFVKNIVHA